MQMMELRHGSHFHSPSDIFSLSFAGSGEAAGVWITKGEQLDLIILYVYF